MRRCSNTRKHPGQVGCGAVREYSGRSSHSPEVIILPGPFATQQGLVLRWSLRRRSSPYLVKKTLSACRARLRGDHRRLFSKATTTMPHYRGKVPLLLIVLVILSPARSAAQPPARSHPPLRTVPPPPERPLSKGPTYFVDAGRGDDKQAGSKAAPWKTLRHAVEQLKAGDTLYLRGGVYFENVAVRLVGRSDAPIVLASFPGEQACRSESRRSRQRLRPRYQSSPGHPGGRAATRHVAAAGGRFLRVHSRRWLHRPGQLHLQRRALHGHQRSRRRDPQYHRRRQRLDRAARRRLCPLQSLTGRQHGGRRITYLGSRRSLQSRPRPGRGFTGGRTLLRCVRSGLTDRRGQGGRDAVPHRRTTLCWCASSRGVRRQRLNCIHYKVSVEFQRGGDRVIETG